MDLKLALVITSLWLGFVLAISFFETPIRFSAPLVDLKIGVSIGKPLFKYLHFIEWIFFFTTSALCIQKDISTTKLFIMSGLLLILLSQSALLIVLNKRAQILISGQELVPSLHHTLYVYLEIIKTLLLLRFITFFFKRI